MVSIKDVILDIIEDLNCGADLQVLKKKYLFRIVESHKGRNFTLYEIVCHDNKAKILYINPEKRWYLGLKKTSEV